MTEAPDTGSLERRGGQEVGSSGQLTRPVITAPRLSNEVSTEGEQNVDARHATQGRQGELKRVRTPRVISPKQGSTTSSVGVQEWEGVVESVGDTHFRARLKDLTRGTPATWTDFDLDEVSDDDRRLVQPGAFFYWIVARRTNAARRRTAESFIHFRRLPAVTVREEKIALDDARRWADAFGVE